MDHSGIECLPIVVDGGVMNGKCHVVCILSRVVETSHASQHLSIFVSQGLAI